MENEYLVYKIHGRCDLESSLLRIQSNCPEYRGISYNRFMKCHDNVYMLRSPEKHLAGIIACRRLESSEIPEALADYHPQRNRVAYCVEALHFENDIPVEVKKSFIETCFVDKNDAFIFLAAKCPNLIANPKCIEECGFKLKIDDDGNKWYIKAPTVYGEVFERLKHFAKRGKSRRRDG